MTWPRRPEHGRIARVGAHLLAVVAVLLAVCAPAAAQGPDPAPPAPGPAPDPAPQAAAPAQAPAPAAPAPAAPAPRARLTEPVPAAGRRTGRARRSRRVSRANVASEPSGRGPPRAESKRAARSRPRTFGVTTIPASVPAPRLVIERSSQLATAEARLAALALLVAAAGSLGLIGHLRRETPDEARARRRRCSRSRPRAAGRRRRSDRELQRLSPRRPTAPAGTRST